MDMSTRSENHETDDFLDFWKVKFKSYESKMTQNNSTELLGHAFLKKISVKKAPQTLADAKSKCFHRAPAEPLFVFMGPFTILSADPCDIWVGFGTAETLHFSTRMSNQLSGMSVSRGESVFWVWGGLGGHFYCKF